jgi:ATP-dependent RNA helicase DHX29
MAGAKKKKKPAANPARGFATTSIASKPRPEVNDESKSAPNNSASNPPSAAPLPVRYGDQPGAKEASSNGKPLTAEEFEKELEESELQLIVERYAQKVKRDAQRQRTRLETDRRLLRSQADPVNTLKWLPQDLMDQIIDMIKAESRFAVSSLSSESTGAGRMPSEEDMIIRLWTLRQTLAAADFPEHRVESVIRYILDISPTISSTSKDLVWGLEEALEWLARECTSEELPAYEPKPKSTPKGITRTTPFFVGAELSCF